MRAIPIRLRFVPVALAFFASATFIGTLIATPALATDGVLEINQACAVNTGCFAGDAAAYPVTITGSAGRSYRLTSDLVVPDENTDAIQVSTSIITIDLNGFEITRSACVGASTNCTPVAGFGSGVETTASLHSGISVKNGSITGMGDSGVRAGAQTDVTNLRVQWNRIYGIYGDTGSTISGSTAHENSVGISVGYASIVSGNVASGNVSLGIKTLSGATVSGNVAYQNGYTGISGDYGTTVSGNTAYNNSGSGIAVGLGGTVSGNTAYFNASDGISADGGASTVSGNTAYGNGDDGISVSGSSAVQHNTVRSNGDKGLSLTPSSTYSDNSITNNTVDGVDFGVNKGANYCAGPGVVLATCP